MKLISLIVTFVLIANSAIAQKDDMLCFKANEKEKVTMCIIMDVACFFREDKEGISCTDW